MQGLEEVLARELSSIGANDVKPARRAVHFTADKDLIYKSNLRLRTALRVLKPLRHFKAADEDALYTGAKAIAWTELFSVEKTFAVKSTVSGELHRHSHYAALKVKDAIVDQFRDVQGSRPNVDIKQPDVVVHVKIHRSDVWISLDSSGRTLNMRGYRAREAKAPLNECLAAGMLMLGGYEGKTAFVDGMCGSGTLAIEAAMIAMKIAPGLMRKDFAFMHWKDFDAELFDIIREASVQRITEPAHPIVALDIDIHAARMAKESVERAQLSDVITVSHGDFFGYSPPPAPGFLVLNPPYGERLHDRDLEGLYKRIGDKLKADFTGYRAWILSGNREAMFALSLRSFISHHLLNGGIECRYSGFQLYKGSREPNTRNEEKRV